VSIGVNWAAIWAPVWKAVWTQSPPAPTPTPSPPTPSGGKAKRGRGIRRYTIRIESQVFEADTEAQAIAILEQAKALAELAAERKADEVVVRALPRATSLGAVKPIQLKAPTVQASRELTSAVADAQAAIDRAYANASALAELRLLLALAEDEDEEELLLLH
jgi:hypothetical protein